MSESRNDISQARHFAEQAEEFGPGVQGMHYSALATAYATIALAREARTLNLLQAVAENFPNEVIPAGVDDNGGIIPPMIDSTKRFDRQVAMMSEIATELELKGWES